MHNILGTVDVLTNLTQSSKHNHSLPPEATMTKRQQPGMSTVRKTSAITGIITAHTFLVKTAKHVKGNHLGAHSLFWEEHEEYSAIICPWKEQLCDHLPEWGRCKISNGHWLPHLREIWWLMSIGNFTSASFWQRVITTAPFKVINNWIVTRRSPGN